MVGRVVNKQLNRAGFFWARKFSTLEEATASLREYSIGNGRMYMSPHSKLPYWVLLKTYISVDS